MKIICKALYSIALITSTMAMNQPNTPTQQNTSCLTQTFQNELVKLGDQVLRDLYSHRSIDLTQKNYFEEIQKSYGTEITNSQYSTLAAWAPSNLLRYALSSGDEPYIKTRKNHLAAIIAVVWKLNDMMGENAFERGSFTLIDPEHRLYNFLLGYVKLTTGYDNPQALPFLLTSCNFAYRRDPQIYGSSHHVYHCPESQFGIDMRFDPHGGVLKLLPYNATHFLFAKLNLGDQKENLLFIKWEEIGMGSLGATLSHGIHFGHSQSNVKAEARREKDIKSEITLEFGKLRDLNTTIEQPTTIWEMIKIAKGVAENDLLSIPIRNAATDFSNFVTKLYPHTPNHIRCGNEAILDMTPFQEN